MLVKWAVMQTMSAMLPGASVAHGGARVGVTGLPTRRLPAHLFAAAPRLHNGLKPDEVPAVLQIGEKVTSRAGVASENKLLSRMANSIDRLASSSGRPLRVTIMDKRQTARELLASRDGEQMVMTHVSKNQ